MASSRAERTTMAMRKSSPTRAVLAGTGVFVLVFLVALGSSRSLAQVGGPGHLLSARLIVGDLFFVCLSLALVVLGGLVYGLWGGRRWRRRRDEETEWIERPAIAWWEKALLLAMALLPVAALVGTLVYLAGRSAHRAGPTQTIVPPSIATVPRQGTTRGGHAAGPVVHWWLFAAAAALLVAMVAVALVQRCRASRDTESAVEVRGDGVQAVIEETLESLERERDPRRAVIRAYTGMERALAQRGLGQLPFEAPLEYLARALVALRVSRRAGERLTALFQWARFSAHPVDPEMKREAIAALTAVRDELVENTR